MVAPPPDFVAIASVLCSNVNNNVYRLRKVSTPFQYFYDQIRAADSRLLQNSKLTQENIPNGQNLFFPFFLKQQF